MNRSGLLLCGIAATGEIFKFGGILFLIAFNLITVVNPYLTFSNASCLIVATSYDVWDCPVWGAAYITYCFSLDCKEFSCRVKYSVASRYHELGELFGLTLNTVKV